ncbi:hypothetical protein STEG23_013314, partial [Scotinomys teguina]
CEESQTCVSGVLNSAVSSPPGWTVLFHEVIDALCTLTNLPSDWRTEPAT